MIYFTSDLHFYHENAIKFTDRPYSNADEMNEALIENWNRRIHPNDEVYILGDVTMQGPLKAMAVLRHLNGRKYLVRGNHDLFVDKQAFDKTIFEWVKDYHRLNIDKKQLILFHFPIEDWDRKKYGSIHLHGHIHSTPEYNLENAKNGILRYDVGVDANNMMPVSIEEIFEFFKDTKGETE